MPTIMPNEPLASWPCDEGVIGVVGVAPWATIDFLQSLYSLVVADKDWDYPRVISDINTKIPSRGRYLELGERSPVPFIKATIKELTAIGATVVIVPCNTAHILYHEWSSNSQVIIPNIIQETVQDMLQQSAKRVSVLASAAVDKYDLYHKPLVEAGLSVIRLSELQQSLVSAAISDVKVNGTLSEDMVDKIDSLLRDLSRQGAEGIILGCTELKCITSRCYLHNLVVSESNMALAKAALRLVNIKKYHIL
ncbi:TPA: aspartate/glutamate racemase family protein [Aeromonas hydrophila]|uniref:aspartate/glutamate racemase family protein n=1 Tax=Aeromonas hydrophila TaxID=644 RepID=UPI00366AE15D